MTLKGAKETWPEDFGTAVVANGSNPSVTMSCKQALNGTLLCGLVSVHQTRIILDLSTVSFASNLLDAPLISDPIKAQAEMSQNCFQDSTSCLGLILGYRKLEEQF